MSDEAIVPTLGRPDGRVFLLSVLASTGGTAHNLGIKLITRDTLNPEIIREVHCEERVNADVLRQQLERLLSAWLK